MSGEYTGETHLDKAHIPVLLGDVVDALAVKGEGFYVDATFGAGGYSRALLNHGAGSVTAIDRDPTVRPVAEEMEREFAGRFMFLAGEFACIEKLIAERHGPEKRVDGVVFDVGVSSMQLDDGDRGFSFQYDGPLDMRMSREGMSAKEAVNELDEKSLADVLYYYGGERKSRAVASKIVRARSEAPVETTAQLAKLVRSCFPRPKGGIDNATRTFQALRIYVNDELAQLERALLSAWRLLKPGGILAAVTFHSLEDAIVKRFMLSLSSVSLSPAVSSDSFERLLPPEGVGERITKKPVVPSKQEIASNPRSRSAKMRAARKL